MKKLFLFLAAGAFIAAAQSTPPAVRFSNASANGAADADRLLDRVREALGGAPRLKAIKDIDYTAEIELSGGPGRDWKGTLRKTYLLPSSMRQEIKLPPGAQTTYSSGESGWIVSREGVQSMPAEVVKQIEGEMFRLLYNIVKRAPVKVAATNTLEFSDLLGNTARLAVDPASSLPLARSFNSLAPGGPLEITETFSDWRDVNGIKVPFERSGAQDGRQFSSVRILEFRFNTGITAQQLSTKP